MTKLVKRLFEQFIPENYQLEIALDDEAMTFSGKVTIKGKKNGRPSRRLTFHQKGLQVTSAQVVKHSKHGDEELVVDRINNHDKYDEVRLHSKQMVYPSNYTITLKFSGKITDTMEGLYPCYYKKKGKNYHVLATQFESHHAREVFPCIDEPQAKATFDLGLVTPKNDVVLSNTPIKSRTLQGDSLQKTVFETTPVMSCYLLAFAVGDFHGVIGKTKNGIEVRSWATTVQPKSHLEYANQEAINTLEFFEEYFQTPFPLKKLDQVALPDFAALAMENWGLITYREVGLLADKENRSISGEQLISTVIAHEIAHQWFGNLVTMMWWDDLWLNESFASVMETLAPNHLHPEWHWWEEFVEGRVISCAVRDVYKDVQPVGVGVKHPDEIHSLFDPSIVYAKGARLIKMLYAYIGEENFSLALKNYFKKHAFKNTTRDDLWDELSEVSGQDIKALMTPWLVQSGTPSVNIDQKGNQLYLNQSRFLLDSTDKQSIWPIPLLPDKELSVDIFDKRTINIEFSGNQVPVFNAQGYSHFISNYTNEASRKNINKKIIDQSIEPTGRIVALNDMLLLANRGDRSLVEVLQLVSQCSTEDRSSVWSLFARAMGLAQLLTDGDEECEEQLRKYRRVLAKHWYQKLGWDDKPDDDPNIKHLRTTALALTLSGEDSEAVKIALKKFDEAKSTEDLAAEQRAMIVACVVKFGKTSDIDKLMNEHTTTHRSDIQESIAAGLCATRDVKVAQKIVEWGLAKDGAIRPQDVLHWFAYLMRNRHTRAVAWQWLVNDWDEIVERIGGEKALDYVVRYASGPISSKEWQAKFVKFFEPKKSIIPLARNITISLNEIAARVAWRDRDLKNIESFFKN